MKDWDNECEKIGCPFTMGGFEVSKEGAKEFEQWKCKCPHTSQCSLCDYYRERIAEIERALSFLVIKG